jgi:hypothetical protein
MVNPCVERKENEEKMKRWLLITLTLVCVIVAGIFIYCDKTQLRDLKSDVVQTEILEVEPQEIWVYRYDNNTYAYIIKQFPEKKYYINDENIQKEINRYIRNQKERFIAIVIIVIIAIITLIIF